MMKCTLADIVKFFNGKVRPKEEGLIPVYGGNGVLGYCSNSNYSGETIIIGRVGAFCGATYFEQQPIWVSDNALAAKQRTNYHIKYLYYLIKNLNLNKYAQGSSHPLLTQRLLNSIEINVHESICDQNKIANLLSTLDDKIELNKKINQTLESIAQNIFRSWFVDFDPVHAKANAQSEDEYDAIAKELGISREILDLFPNEFEESELGLIPKGWEVDEIGNIINIVGGGTPSTKNKDFWDGGNVNWSTPKDLSSLDFPVLLDTERKITEQGLKKISSGLLEEGTLLLSSRAPIGYIAISKIPVAINQGFIAIPPNQKLSSIFLLYWTRNNIDVIKSYSGGTTFQEISKKNFRLIKLILPSANLLDAFNELASNLFNSIVMKEMENKSLQEIRDNLLPKLLSGEIDVSNLNLEPEND
ncbi:restriction endonuclease subunit S [Legionella pneumophila serogroup 1]|uniref:restriction endonuclease subunit S n=1 Tax=Legionella pneumophila TaxID=446 RepID=UPI000777A63D|nr:restriction endonuclease subunit S [Legionella pneumophila]MCK1849880.1 restriction endonuclease subunit S [Legionella pneumophila]HAT8612907.1 restriction endonuclease subunit S [Legionella pneumophila]HAU1146509.1 restriction endonuclease subunit S [Legionella pneumophila]HCC0368442.1 restriction endonuclease subunit S [Legionella pneumophila]HCC0555765.1 restriction endonuclease subunit S [Legionella pneumophila]